MSMPQVKGGPYERVVVQGHTLNNRTVAMLTEMEARLGYDLTVLQGSYNAGGVSASSGTHDGGGAVDLAPFDWANKVRVGRRVGFAIWHRTPIPDVWPEHCHGIAIGDREMSDAAASQVVQYQAHTDGLAGHSRDDFPFHPNGREFDYAAWRKRRHQAALRARRAANALKRAIRALVRARQLSDDKATKADIQKAIEQLRSHP